jgi:hypothetical protein
MFHYSLPSILYSQFRHTCPSSQLPSSSRLPLPIIPYDETTLKKILKIPAPISKALDYEKTARQEGNPDPQ